MADDLRSIPGLPGAEAEALLTKAVRCRRLAAQLLDQRASRGLRDLALECEAKAAELMKPGKSQGVNNL